MNNGSVCLNDDELDFLMRYCKGSIEISKAVKEFNAIFSPETGFNIEKCNQLLNKLHSLKEKASGQGHLNG